MDANPAGALITFRRMSRPRILYVTDLNYQAAGRRYCDEDIYLSDRLRSCFDLALCHPSQAASLMDSFDVVVVRNSGPVIHYADVYDDFRRQAKRTGARVFNELTGKADMVGKQYLLDLFEAGYPVIPTIESPDALPRLPASEKYVVKPKLGADSVGLQVVSGADLLELNWDGMLVQPRVDFSYEVSFYFIGRAYQYAMYTPDPARRWDLRPYEASDADLVFAQRFVDWNAITHGVQRVDACRTIAGDLLLVELEDLNPYLSLDLLPDADREAFIVNLTEAVRELAAPT